MAKPETDVINPSDVVSSDDKRKNDDKKETILLTVKKILADQIGADPASIREDSHFNDDFALDSLDQVEVIMRCEEAFDITIPDDVAERIRTVSDIIKYIEENM